MFLQCYQYTRKSYTRYIFGIDTALGINPIGYINMISDKRWSLAFEYGRIALDHVFIVNLRLKELFDHCNGIDEDIGREGHD